MNELPYNFDLLFDIKSYEELDDELCKVFKRMHKLVQMCEQHGIDSDKVPNFKNLVEGAIT